MLRVQALRLGLYELVPTIPEVGIAPIAPDLLSSPKEQLLLLSSPVLLTEGGGSCLGATFSTCQV